MNPVPNAGPNPPRDLTPFRKWRVEKTDEAITHQHHECGGLDARSMLVMHVGQFRIIKGPHAFDSADPFRRTCAAPADRGELLRQRHAVERGQRQAEDELDPVAQDGRHIAEALRFLGGRTLKAAGSSTPRGPSPAARARRGNA